MNKLVAMFTVIFCAGLFACANWSTMTPAQKADLACNVSVDIVKPECLRVDVTKQSACNATFEAIRTSCIAAVEQDAAAVCPFVRDSSARCAEVFEDPLDVSSCQRAFTAAYGICVLNVPPPAPTVE
jgi:hypothetical protein